MYYNANELAAATAAILKILVADEQLIPPIFRGMIPQEKVAPLAAQLAKAAFDAAEGV